MPTIAEKLKSREQDLTRAERQLASAILDNYPIPGLGSITELAELAAVSTPTVARMVQKLGFSGYPEFQQALRAELSEIISNPRQKHAQTGSTLPETHMLTRFARAAFENLEATLEGVNPAEFDQLCAALSDPGRSVHIAGGRMSGTLAQNLFLHMQMVRTNVSMIPSQASWPHWVLDMEAGDLLVLFDIRRYENSTLLLAEMAHERGVEVVLFTDQWRSPVQKFATLTFAARIGVPSAWDSSLAILLLIEALIAKIQEDHWEQVQQRNDALETAFDRTRLFRKFT